MFPIDSIKVGSKLFPTTSGLMRHLDTNASIRHFTCRCLHRDRKCIHSHIIHRRDASPVARSLLSNIGCRTSTCSSLWDVRGHEGIGRWKCCWESMACNLYVYPSCSFSIDHRIVPPFPYTLSLVFELPGFLPRSQLVLIITFSQHWQVHPRPLQAMP